MHQIYDAITYEPTHNSVKIFFNRLIFKVLHAELQQVSLRSAIFCFDPFPRARIPRSLNKVTKVSVSMMQVRAAHRI